MVMASPLPVVTDDPNGEQESLSFSTTFTLSDPHEAIIAHDAAVNDIVSDARAFMLPILKIAKEL